MAKDAIKTWHRGDLSMLCFIIILFSSTVTLVFAKKEKQQQPKLLRIPALGLTAHLGGIYDARNNSFMGYNIFTKMLNPDKEDYKEIVTIDQIFKTDLERNVVRNLSDKFVGFTTQDTEIKLAVMSDFVKIESGSAKYLQDETKLYKNDAEGFLSYKVKTESHTFNFMYNKAKEYLNMEVLKNIMNATHMVVAIEYGGDLTIRYTVKADAKSEKGRAEGELDATFQRARTLRVGTTKNATIELGSFSNITQFSLKLFGDMEIEGDIPKTEDEVEALINKVPGWVKKGNGGRGTAMFYTLMPLNEVASRLAYDLANYNIVAELDMQILHQFTEMFDAIAAVSKQVRSLKKKLEDHRVCTKAEDMSKIQQLEKDFDAATIKFKMNVRNGMYLARINDKNTEELKSTLEEYNDNEQFSAKKVQAVVEKEFQKATKKIEQYKFFQSQGIPYFGRDSTFDNLRLATQDKILYALYLKEGDGKNYEDNWNLLLRLRHAYSLVAIVDCDFPDPVCEYVTTTVTKQYYKSLLKSPDLVEYMAKWKKQEAILVSAVGRRQNIGDLYNFQTNKFLEEGESVYLQTMPRHNITEVNLNNVENFTIVDSTLEAKFKALGITPATLQLRILQNPGGFEKIGHTFRETACYDPRRVSKTLVYHYSTIERSVKPPTKWSFKDLNLMNLAESKATHFVQKIMYGAQTTITMSHVVSDEPGDETRVRKAIVEDLKRIEKDSLLSWKKTRETAKSITPQRDTYLIQVTSDITLTPSQVLDDKKELREYLNNFPDAKFKPDESNPELGEPILYTLYPLENLHEYFGSISMLRSENQGSLPQETSLRFAYKYDAIRKAQESCRSINRELSDTLIQGRPCVTDKTKEDIEKLQKELDDLTGNWAAFQLKRVLDDNEDAESILEQLKTEDFDQKVKEFEAHRKKLKFLKDMMKNYTTVQYYGHGDDLITGLSQKEVKDKFVFVLFYHVNFTKDGETDPRFSKNFNLLVGHLNGKDYNKLVLLDCDFGDRECIGLERSTIKMYKNGRILSSDVLFRMEDGQMAVRKKETQTINRRSIGRSAKIGDLYNMRTESFTGQSIFKSTLNPNNMPEYLVNTRYSEPGTEYGRSTMDSINIAERFKAYDIDKTFQLSLILRNLEKKGSGRVLDESPDFSRAVLVTLNTSVTSLNLDSPELPKLFQPTIFNVDEVNTNEDFDGPTHFLREIHLGSNTLLAVGKQVIDIQQEERGRYQQCHDDLKFIIDNLGVPSQRLAIATKTEALMTPGRCNLQIFADFVVGDPDSELERTENFPRLIQELAKERRMTPTSSTILLIRSKLPILFVFEPLENLEEPLGVLTPDYTYTPVPSRFESQNIVKYFDRLTQALNDSQRLEAKMLHYENCITNNSLSTIREQKYWLERLVEDFRDTYLPIFEDALMNVGNRSELITSLKKFEDDLGEIQEDYTVDEINDKIELYRHFTRSEEQVDYVGRYGSLKSLRETEENKIVYALIVKDYSNISSWKNLSDIYIEKLQRPFARLAVIDCEFPHPECNTTEENVLHQYFQTDAVSKNVEQDLLQVDDQDAIEVSAIGRVHKIGDLYNAHSNEFLSGPVSSILKPGSEGRISVVTSDLINQTSAIVSNNLADKFKELQIRPSTLQYTILLNTNGYQKRIGRTFQERDGFDPNLVSRTLVYEYNRAEEKIESPDIQSFDFLSIQQIKNTRATHFVQKIVNGAQTTISLSSALEASYVNKNSSSEIKTRLEELLEEFRQILLSSDQEEASVPRLPEDISVTFASDLLETSSGSVNPSSNQEQLTDFLSQFPVTKNAQDANKVIPVLYVMYPLVNLQKHLGAISVSGLNKTASVRNFELGLELAQISDALEGGERQMEVIKSEAKKYPSIVSDETVTDITRVLRQVQDHKANFRQQFSALVKEVSPKPDSELRTFLQGVKNKVTSDGILNLNLEFEAHKRFRHVMEKVKFVQKMEAPPLNFKYIGRGKTLDSALQDIGQNGEFVYVLLFKFVFTTLAHNMLTWSKNVNLLTRNLIGKPYNKIILLDCDFRDIHCQGVSQPLIKLFVNGQVQIPNVLETWKKAETQNGTSGTIRGRTPVTMERQAVGRLVKLGDLYNIHSENFTKASIFKANFSQNFDLNKDFVIKTPLPQHELEVKIREVSATNLWDRLVALDVEPDLQLSLFFQVIEMQRSGKFLDGTKDFYRALARTDQRGTARLTLDDKSLPYYIEPANVLSSQVDQEDMGEETAPTHYVREIRFGANTIVGLSKPSELDGGEDSFGNDEYSENDYDSDITFGAGTNTNANTSIRSEQECILQLKYVMSYTGSGQLPLNMQKEVKILSKSGPQCNFESYTDISDANNARYGPQSKFSALITELSNIRERERNNEGTPTTVLSFVLEPLASLSTKLGLLTPPQKIQQGLPASLKVKNIIDAFSALVGLKRETEKLQKDLLVDDECATESADIRIQTVVENLEVLYDSLKARVQQSFVQVKQGHLNATGDLRRVGNDIKKEMLKIDKFEEEKQKLKFFQFQARLKSGHAISDRYLGRKNEGNFQKVFESSYGRPIFILFFRNISAVSGSSSWLQTTDLFFNTLDGEKNACFIVDCDFAFPECDEVVNSFTIYQYREGRPLSVDYLQDYLLAGSKVEDERMSVLKIVEGIEAHAANLNRSVATVERSLGRVETSLESKANAADLTRQNTQVKKIDAQVTRFQRSINDLKNNVNRCCRGGSGGGSGGGAAATTADSSSSTDLSSITVVTDRLNASIADLQMTCEELKSNQTKLELRTVVLEGNGESLKRIHGRLVWKIENVKAEIELAKSKDFNFILYSEPFYSDPYGYKLRAMVELNGNEDYRDSHVSVFIQVMPGEFDVIQTWPFPHSISFTLRDQDDQGVVGQSTIYGDMGPTNFQRPQNNEPNPQIGKPDFVSHEDLFSGGVLKDDVMFLDIEVFKN